MKHVVPQVVNRDGKVHTFLPGRIALRLLPDDVPTVSSISPVAFDSASAHIITGTNFANDANQNNIKLICQNNAGVSITTPSIAPNSVATNGGTTLSFSISGTVSYSRTHFYQFKS